jgi:hypothetical protein
MVRELHAVIRHAGPGRLDGEARRLELSAHVGGIKEAEIERDRMSPLFVEMDGLRSAGFSGVGAVFSGVLTPRRSSTGWGDSFDCRPAL